MYTKIPANLERLWASMGILSNVLKLSNFRSSWTHPLTTLKVKQSSQFIANLSKFSHSADHASDAMHI